MDNGAAQRGPGHRVDVQTARTHQLSDPFPDFVKDRNSVLPSPLFLPELTFPWDQDFRKPGREGRLFGLIDRPIDLCLEFGNGCEMIDGHGHNHLAGAASGANSP